MTDNAKELLALARIARAFLAHFNPTQLAEDASQQWQALEHECEKVERLSARQQASVEKRDHITRQMLRDEPDTLFVFGDNMVERGFGGQAKEMRGEPNAVGIPTKLLPDRSPASYFRDQDLERARPKINAAFLRLAFHALRGGKIVWPSAGIGTGLAELETRAPAIWKLIAGYRRALFEKVEG